EAGVGDVRARAALVAVRLRGTDDVARLVDRDEGPAGRVVQPARAGALLGGVAVPGERFPGGHDPADDGPDLWPVFLRRVSDQHGPTIGEALLSSDAALGTRPLGWEDEPSQPRSAGRRGMRGDRRGRRPGAVA